MAHHQQFVSLSVLDFREGTPEDQQLEHAIDVASVSSKNLGENDIAFRYLRASRLIREIGGENFAGEPKQFRR